jgi:hypothetical protein
VSAVARTIAEAETQAWSLPSSYDGWREFALLIDGYAIATEMGSSAASLAEIAEATLAETGDVELTVLQARVVIFFEQRRDRHNGCPNHRLVNHALALISRQTGQAYTPLSEEEIASRMKKDMDSFLRHG